VRRTQIRRPSRLAYPLPRAGGEVARPQGETERGCFKVQDRADRQDVEKLQRVQLALRNGDLAAVAKEAKVHELLPISP
jgi:hypothetical protein